MVQFRRCGREVCHRSLAHSLIGRCRRDVFSCTVNVAVCAAVLQKPVALNRISVVIARLNVADSQCAAVTDAADRDSSAEIAVIQNGRALLPNKGKWARA